MMRRTHVRWQELATLAGRLGLPIVGHDCGNTSALALDNEVLSMPPRWKEYVRSKVGGHWLQGRRIGATKIETEFWGAPVGKNTRAFDPILTVDFYRKNPMYVGLHVPEHTLMSYTPLQSRDMLRAIEQAVAERIEQPPDACSYTVPSKVSGRLLNGLLLAPDNGSGFGDARDLVAAEGILRAAASGVELVPVRSQDIPILMPTTPFGALDLAWRNSGPGIVDGKPQTHAITTTNWWQDYAEPLRPIVLGPRAPDADGENGASGYFFFAPGGVVSERRLMLGAAAIACSTSVHDLLYNVVLLRGPLDVVPQHLWKRWFYGQINHVDVPTMIRAGMRALGLPTKMPAPSEDPEGAIAWWNHHETIRREVLDTVRRDFAALYVASKKRRT